MEKAKKNASCAGRILQNVYLSVARTAEDLNTKNESKKYFELRRNVVSDGIKEELVAVDYPITPDYVKSFSDSADYKKDIAGAVAQSAQNTRSNLGDITALQDVLSKDTESVRKLRADIKQVIANIEKAQKEKSVEVKKEGENV